MQTVTTADVEHGWLCEGEGCRRPFQPGDNAYGLITAITADGTPVEGDWRCNACWTETTP